MGRAIRRAWPAADGLTSDGINAGTVCTLFRPAQDSIGATPYFDRPLADRAIEAEVATAAETIGYGLI